MTDIIGIDPGTQTGVAIIHGGRLVELSTFTPLEAIHGLSGEWELRYSECIVCIEDTRNLPIYQDKRGKGGNAIHRVARSVGLIDGLCTLYTEAAQSSGLKVLHFEPSGPKWDRDMLRKIALWERKSNQHQRDAARAALWAAEIARKPALLEFHLKVKSDK